MIAPAKEKEQDGQASSKKQEDGNRTFLVAVDEEEIDEEAMKN